MNSMSMRRCWMQGSLFFHLERTTLLASTSVWKEMLIVIMRATATQQCTPWPGTSTVTSKRRAFWMAVFAAVARARPARVRIYLSGEKVGIYVTLICVDVQHPHTV